jgi:hypothetical protein
MRNFASTSAIVTALRSITLTRLKLTYNRLTKDDISMLDETEALLNSRGTHATMTSSNNFSYIPFLGKQVAYCTQ